MKVIHNEDNAMKSEALLLQRVNSIISNGMDHSRFSHE